MEPGFKMQKDRAVIKSFTHKFPSLLIGKSTKPRPFENIKRNALQVKCHWQKKKNSGKIRTY
jgi:hypothetical protein